MDNDALERLLLKHIRQCLKQCVLKQEYNIFYKSERINTFLCLDYPNYLELRSRTAYFFRSSSQVLKQYLYNKNVFGSLCLIPWPERLLLYYQALKI